MNTETMPIKKAHHGRNVKRLREMLGVKQEAIALALDMTQQNMSLLEQKEEIEDKLLEQIAKILKVPADAIKNMTDDLTQNFINTFYDNSTGYNYIHQCTFNPLDKVIELYERIVKAEQEKVAMLETMLKENK